MKKHVMTVILMTFALLLSACADDTTPSEKDGADRVIDAWEGDFSHIEDATESMTLDDGYVKSRTVKLQMGDDTHSITLDAELTVQSVERQDVTVTEIVRDVTVMDDERPWTDEKSHYTRMILETHPGFTDVYIHEDTVTGMLESHGPFASDKFFTLYGIDDAWLRFRIHDDMKDILDTDILTLMIVDEDFDMTWEDFAGISWAIDWKVGLRETLRTLAARIKPAMNFLRLPDEESGELDIEADDERNVVTTMKTDHMAVGTLLEGLLVDIIATSQDIEAFGMFDAAPDADEVRKALESMKDTDPIAFTFTYHPDEFDGMTVGFDDAAFMEDFIRALDNNVAEDFTVETARVTTVLSEDADFDPPDEYADGNRVIDEYLMVEMLESFYHDFESQPDWWTPNTYPLADIPGLGMEAYYLLDKETSTLTFNDEVSIMFYYVDGAPVFKDTVHLEHLSALFAEYEGDSPKRNTVSEMLGLVNEDAFHITRFLAMAVQSRLDEAAKVKLQEATRDLIDDMRDFCDTASDEEYHVYCRTGLMDGASDYLTDKDLDDRVAAPGYRFAFWRDQWNNWEFIVVGERFYNTGNTMVWSTRARTDETLESLIEERSWEARSSELAPYVVLPGERVVDRDPNNTSRENAMALESGETVEGTLPPGETHHYFLDVKAGETVTILVFPDFSDHVDEAILTLKDADGDVLAIGSPDTYSTPLGFSRQNVQIEYDSDETGRLYISFRWEEGFAATETYELFVYIDAD